MIQDAKNRPISELFDIDSKLTYVIPKYQREYTWVQSQWESLFDDLWDNRTGYFIGSIICINQATDALDIQKLEVVDGQQRLMTLSLLFAALYAVLSKSQDEMDEDTKHESYNLKYRFILRRSNDQLRVIPQIQNNNYNDYRAVLAAIGVIGAYDPPAYAGNRKIFRAFRYFKSRIKAITDDQDKPLTAIIAFLDKINQACLVKIEVANHADAYTLFESLNNRGLPLTAIDLIKNKLLARLESNEPGRVDHYFEHWNRLLEYLGDDYSVQERFFRQYYNAFKEELKHIHQVPIATRSNLIQIFEKLIDHDAQNCLEKIIEAGRHYALFLFRHQDDTRQGLEKPLKDLERIQGAPSYLFMLYLLVRKDVLQLDHYHLAEIVVLLVRFFVRRNLTDTPPTRDLTRLFMAIIEKLADITGETIVTVVREGLIAVSASDEAFQSKLEGPIYEENAGVTRFILCALAEREMTRETCVDLWRVENKQFVWTIEHVFPQGEHIPLSWVRMIADGDEQQARAYQQTHVHKLGNLTISGFNSALGNKSFEEKRDRTNRQGHQVGYKSGLKLNKELADAETWSVTQIDNRTTDLAKEAMNLFKMNGSDV